MRVPAHTGYGDSSDDRLLLPAVERTNPTNGMKKGMKKGIKKE
jgi:hypothetical protein